MGSWLSASPPYPALSHPCGGMVIEVYAISVFLIYKWLQFAGYETKYEVGAEVFCTMEHVGFNKEQVCFFKKVRGK